MKILIMGAGAVGAYYGAQLQRAGEDVVFCARGDNLRAMREKGLEIKSFKGDIKLAVRATGDPHEFGPYDLVLFAVKSYDTESAARQLEGCLVSDGVLMTIQNGVENEEVLCRSFPREMVMGGNSRVGAELVAPAKVLQLIGNSSTNSVSALSHTTLGQMLEEPDGFNLVRTLMLETLAVGRAEGAKVSDDRVDAQLGMIRKSLNAAAIKTSTLQDLEKGKPLEYEAISGAVVRAARRHNMKVPATETVYTLLRLLEKTRKAAG